MVYSYCISVLESPGETVGAKRNESCHIHGGSKVMGSRRGESKQLKGMSHDGYIVRFG